MLNRLRIGAGIAIAALVLTGCGGDEGDTTTTSSSSGSDIDPQEDPGAYFEAVSAATQEAGSYRMDLTESGTAEAGASSDMSALVIYEGDGLLTEVTPDGEGFGMIQTSDTLYMSDMPDIPPEFEGKWVTLDLDGAMGQMMGNEAAPTDMVNPDLFAEVGEIDLSVADGGEVDGVSTQEISFTLTADQLATTVPDDNPMAEAARSQLRDTSYVIKVGDDMLVRELAVDDGQMTVDGTVHDYGVDETIEVPADEDTVTMEEVMTASMGDLEGGELGDMGELEDELGNLEDELGDLEDELGGAAGTEG